MRAASFFKGLSWLLVLNLLIKPVWIFLIDRQVQNIIGHAAYGEYFAVLGFSYVLLFLADAGLTNMMNQQLANRESVPATAFLRFKLLLSLLYVALASLLFWWSGIQAWWILLYVMAIQLANSFFVFFRNIITAHQYFTADAWFSILDKALMILACGALIYWHVLSIPFSLARFLQIQLVVTLFAMIAALLFSRRWLNPVKVMPLRPLIKQMAPFAAVILLMSMHYRLDGFLLERWHTNGAMEAGIYASAYRLLDASNMVGYLAASFLVPFIARHHKENELINHTLQDVQKLLLFFAIATASFAWIFAPWIQQLLYHDAGAYAAQVTRLCLASLPAYMLVQIYGSVFTAKGQLFIFIRILAVVVVINLVMNYWLIPSYGAEGASMAAIVSQYVCGLSCYAVAQNQLKMPLVSRSTLLYIVLAVALTAFFYGGQVVKLNVWLILAIAAMAVLLLLITQLKQLKKLIA